MGVLIGMDEAGYGPNLGPLVITTTVWDTGDHPVDCDLWEILAEAVTSAPADPTRVRLGDSKALYSPATGLAALELGVQAALGLLNETGGTWKQLLATVRAPEVESEPWFSGQDLPLPHACGSIDIASIETWRRICDKAGVRLTAIRTDVVLTSRFNALTTEHNSKGRALSEWSMKLVRSVWPECPVTPVLVQADKHGGRNRYQELLPLVIDDEFIMCRGESTASSSYRVGRAEFRFETRSERYLPVALASMVSKYIRELAMELFNRYWATHVPGIAPTAGYPQDAKRYRAEIADAQKKLGIGDDVLWRCR